MLPNNRQVGEYAIEQLGFYIHYPISVKMVRIVFLKQQEPVDNKDGLAFDSPNSASQIRKQYKKDKS